MKSLVWTAPETMEIQELERPSIQADEVLIEVKAVGICGSEIEGYLGHNSLRVPPLVMGHEFAGVVVECGAEATGIQIGQKVTVNPLIACGSCARCRQGLVNLCANRSIVGIHRPGAFADYVAVPAANVHVVPADSDLFQLSLTEPLACSLRAARRAMDMHPFANVVVIGAGAIGLLSAMVCRLLGASTVTVLDTNDERLQTALQVCADHALNPTRDDLAAQVPVKDGDTGVDVVIDAAGFQPTRSSAIELLRPGGTLMNIGLGIDDTVLPINHTIRSEIRMLGSFCYDKEDFHDALSLLVSGKISHDGWTEVRPLAAGGDAFADLVSGKVAKGKIILEV